MVRDARGRGGPRSGTGLHSRRTFLRTLYGATLGAVLAACSSNDAEVFAAGDEATSDLSAGSEVSTAGGEGSTAPTLRVRTDQVDASTTTGTATTASPTTSGSSTTSSGGSGGALPAGGTMVVAFTYEQQSGGKNVPPYIAVWIEDGSGNLVTTVALWYQQFGRGERWLPDLTRWYNVDQNRIASGGTDTVDAISGPTRSPGSYQVAWDGRTNGSTAPAGSYFVCIESARERGPYSLIRQSVNLGGAAQQQTLSNDGELVNASIAVTG